MRRIIPACVIKRIREDFPSPDGFYTGFKEGSKEVSETENAWVFQQDDENLEELDST